MVITNENQVVYQGDGVTTAFPFTFRIIDWTDIKLLLLDSDGTETDITSDYYVDTENDTVHYPGYAPGAEPALSDRPPVLAEGQKLVIYRELPITQTKDLGDKWPFFSIELALDKLTMLIQDWKDILARCLKVRVSDAQDGFDATITPEPGMAIQFKRDGSGFECVEPPSEVLAECKEVLADTETVAEGARQSAESAALSAGNASASEQSAMQSAGSAAQAAGQAAQSLLTAQAEVDKVEGYLAAAKDVGLWDETETYQPGEAVMTTDGSTFRCINANVGNNPATSPQYWAAVSIAELKTFEYDRNGDLQPRMYPVPSYEWAIDANGDIMPAA